MSTVLDPKVAPASSARPKFKVADLSLAELGRRLGVSRERTRQLEARARKKLQRTLADLQPALAS